MYKIAICDDQETGVAEISMGLSKYAQARGIIIEKREYLNPLMLIGDMEEGILFDIIFIDIEMPVMNGMDVISRIK